MSAEPEILESSHVFVDTNVLLYAFDTSAGKKRERAADLLKRMWHTGNGCLSIQVLQEFYVNATRKLSKPLEVGIARQIVVSLSRWRVHRPHTDDVLPAIDLQQSAQLSFWDAMILQSAATLPCEVIYSEDLNSGQMIAGMKVINPL